MAGTGQEAGPEIELTPEMAAAAELHQAEALAALDRFVAGYAFVNSSQAMEPIFQLPSSVFFSCPALLLRTAHQMTTPINGSGTNTAPGWVLDSICSVKGIAPSRVRRAWFSYHLCAPIASYMIATL